LRERKPAALNLGYPDGEPCALAKLRRARASEKTL
jgi:hypothetical protein